MGLIIRTFHLVNGLASRLVSIFERRNPEALLEVEKEKLRKVVGRYNEGLVSHATLAERLKIQVADGEAKIAETTAKTQALVKAAETEGGRTLRPSTERGHRAACRGPQATRRRRRHLPALGQHSRCCRRRGAHPDRAAAPTDRRPQGQSRRGRLAGHGERHDGRLQRPRRTRSTGSRRWSPRNARRRELGPAW